MSTSLAPNPPRPLPPSPWLRLAAYYVAAFAVLAIYMSFFPLWLRRDRAIAAHEVAWVWSAQTVARALAGPLWSQRVDRTGRPRQTLIWLSLGSLAAFAGFAFATSLPALLAVAFLFGCFYPPIHAIHDALVMQCGRRHGFRFRRLRGTGSMAFLVTVLLVGWWLDSAPVASVYWLMLATLLVTAAVSFALPADEVAGGESAVRPRAPLGALLGSGSFVLLLAASGLIQGSHAVYYNYSAIHWQNHGLKESTTGMLWAEGVLAEIVLFVWARGGVDRLRPTTLMIAGGLLGAVRWLLVGWTVSVPLLFAANWLHAGSFGLTFLGALRAIDNRVLPNQRATAQGLHGAAAMGLGVVFAALLGGYLFERSPARAFFTMAALAFGGAGLAFWLRRRGNRLAASDQSSAPAIPE
ncbi:MAG: MFS transporter [Planctomycetes bacterium]|nr:MFS transporter [Planctomycetota bacterium]